MSVKECEELLNDYTRWLRQQITVTELETGCEITTPFLDRHNDMLQIYLQRENGHYILSDDGYTLADLQMSGVDLSTPKRQEALETMLRGFGVEQHENALRVKTQKEQLPQRKHALLQAMLAVNDLFLTAQARVASFFYEDVEQYLALHDIRFVPHASFIGRSGYTHQFDFVIPASKKSAERLIKAIGSPNKDNLTSFMFAWQDTKEVRAPHAQAVAFLNDGQKSLRADSLSALEAYNIHPIAWSQRDNSLALLAG